MQKHPSHTVTLLNFQTHGVDGGERGLGKGGSTQPGSLSPNYFIFIDFRKIL